MTIYCTAQSLVLQLISSDGLMLSIVVEIPLEGGGPTYSVKRQK